MKYFTEPNLEIIPFQVKDIITASNGEEILPGPIDPELPGDDFE